MLKGELLLNSTSCSNPQCYREIQPLALFKSKYRDQSSARKALVIRCARQRPQRSTTPKPGPVYVPSNGSEGQPDDENSFLESSPNHRAGKPTMITRTHFPAFIPWSVWESRHMRRNSPLVTSCCMSGTSHLGCLTANEQVPGMICK